MGWISVSDRLPEVGHNKFSRVVLAVDELKKIKTTMLDTEYSERGHWVGFDFTVVTHWMELPDPPNH